MDGSGNVTETSTANFFMYWSNSKSETQLITPKLKDTVLPGMVRDAIYSFAKENKKMVTLTGTIPMKELIQAGKEKRVFLLFY